MSDHVRLSMQTLAIQPGQEFTRGTSNILKTVHFKGQELENSEPSKDIQAHLWNSMELL